MPKDDFVPNYKDSTLKDNKILIFNYANRINLIKNKPFIKEFWVDKKLKEIMKIHKCNALEASEKLKRKLRTELQDLNKKDEVKL